MRDNFFTLACGYFLGAMLPAAAWAWDEDQGAPNASTASSATAQATSTPASSSAEPTTATIKGKVVWLSDTLRKLYGIETDRDAAHDIVAVQTDDGILLPVVRDARGRGFWLDERLRNQEFEFYVRRFPKSPMVQIIRLYTLRPEGKYELDYWCDICAIPMYELKACECCQGPSRLRERRVPPGSETGAEGEEPDDPPLGGKPAPQLPGKAE